MRYTLNSEYYIIIHNGLCEDSQLPHHVNFQDGVLCFDNQTPVEVQVVYILDEKQTMEIEIVVKNHREVNLIETKIFADNAKMYKKMILEEAAIVHIFNENLCINNNKVECVENISLKENAICQCGYAELSDGSFDAQYRYDLDGEGAEAKIRMAILSKHEEKKHFEVTIQHNCPHTYGQMDNYGVVKDAGHLVIDGIGTITKGQHGSASHQTNKIMVFDPACVASANPYLYIDEYDVKASHAAGVGKMDEEHLYYLQSRGLTQKQAMQLITYGYLKPVIEVIDNEMIKERFEIVLSKVGA